MEFNYNNNIRFLWLFLKPESLNHQRHRCRSNRVQLYNYTHVFEVIIELDGFETNVNTKVLSNVKPTYLLK